MKDPKKFFLYFSIDIFLLSIMMVIVGVYKGSVEMLILSFVELLLGIYLYRFYKRLSYENS